jgi:hypothetical protein
MKNTHRILIWVLGLVTASAALAAGHDTALSSSGVIYQVRTGLYGDLFPGGKATDKANTVAALLVTTPGEPTQRFLVPDTVGTDVESSPSVLFEDDSQTAFLLWQSQINIHPILELSAFDGANWSKALTITGNPFALKTSPQFAITRDAYDELAADGTAVTRHRTILHLIWQEERSTPGQLQTFYTPIIVTDGVFIGSNPIYALDDFLPAAASAPVDVQSTLLGAPIVQAGRDERTVVIAYASPALNQLVTVEVDALPEQLTDLGDKARSHIIDIGRQLYPANLPALADQARSHIIDIGRAFHSEVVQSIADQVRSQILVDTSGDLTALAEKARSHIIDIGAKLSGRGLRPNGQDDSLAKVIEIDDPQSGAAPIAQAAPAAPVRYLLQIRAAATWPMPHVGPGPVRVFASPTGEDLTVSWAQGDRILYRNGQPGGWSDPKTLLFSDSLALDKAYDILDQRLRRR